MPCLDILIETPDTGTNPIDITLSGHIVAQNMKLKMAVVQRTATSSPPSAINIDLPWLNRFQIHNSQSGNSYLTIPLDIEKQTTIIYPDINFKSETIPQSFRIYLYNKDGKTELNYAKIEFIELYFDYDQETLF